MPVSLRRSRLRQCLATAETGTSPWGRTTDASCPRPASPTPTPTAPTPAQSTAPAPCSARTGRWLRSVTTWWGRARHPVGNCGTHG
ncbi:hypothetical protein EJK15_17915 [Nonomuraea basaltis]|nr:hypothetical protein EJK15_17915 [Nonomuraea basaltis]